MPKKLDQPRIEEALKSADGWTLQGKSIEKEYIVADFAAAIALINAVAAKAEAADHHPDILLHGWNKVRFTLSTHSEGGLTQNDFDLAQAIDGLEESKSKPAK